LGVVGRKCFGAWARGRTAAFGDERGADVAKAGGQKAAGGRGKVEGAREGKMGKTEQGMAFLINLKKRAGIWQKRAIYLQKIENSACRGCSGGQRPAHQSTPTSFPAVFRRSDGNADGRKAHLFGRPILPW